MSPLTRVVSSLARFDARFGGQRSYPLAPRSGGLGASPGTDRGAGKVRTDVAELASTTFRCIAVRADTLMTLPPRLYKGVGDERDEVTAGPLYDLIHRVNQHWDWPGLIAMTEWALCTSRKGAFWVLDALDGGGRPTEIWYCPAERVEVVQGSMQDDEEDRYIKHFKIDMGMGQKQEFPRSQVVWFRAPSPSDEFTHLAPLLPAMASSVLALDAMAANSMIFKQGLTGAGVVTPVHDSGGVAAPNLTAGDMKDLQKLLTETLKGRSGFHRWLVLNRAYQFQKLDLTPKDAQFVQALGLTREDICIALGVPEPVIHPKDTTFSNMGEARGALWSNCLLGQKLRIESAITSQLLPLFGDEATALELDTSDVPELQEDEAARWQTAQSKMVSVIDLGSRVASRELTREAALKLATYFMDLPQDVAEDVITEPSIDEGGMVEERVLNAAQIDAAKQIVISVALGQLPRDSGVAMLEAFYNRPPEWAEAIMGSVGAGFSLSPPPAPEPAALPAVEDDDTIDGDVEVVLPDDLERAARMIVFERGSRRVRVLDRPAPLLAASHRAYEYDSAEHRAFMRAADDQQEALLPDILAEVRSLFAGQRDSLLSGLAAISDEDLAEIVAELGDDADAIAEAIIARAFDVEDWRNASLARMAERYEPVAEEVGAAVWTEIDAGGTFDPAADGVAQAIARRADTFADTTVATSYRQAAEAVARILRDGGGLDDMADAVREKSADWPKARAENAARTALHGTVMEITLEAADQSGIVEEKEWLSSLDERVRKTHKTAHGQRVAMDADFSVGSGSGRMPGLIDREEENYQCRCVARLITGR